MDGMVAALAVDGAGYLYAGGEFTTAGGTSANHIARWNGSNWAALGTGMDSKVNALALDGAGNLYAGGEFAHAGGIDAKHIALWNGTSWAALGIGTDGGVLSFALDGADLYTGGAFFTAGGIVCNGVARWDGTNWETLGSGLNSNVQALALDGGGNLFAGGSFTTSTGGTSSLFIARNHCAPVLGVEPPPVFEVEGVFAWPNPFTNQVRFAVSLSTSRPVQMEALDVSGRRVWTPPASFPGMGGATFVWDGRASDGARVGQGVYFIRVTDGNGRVLASRAVVRLK